MREHRQIQRLKKRGVKKQIFCFLLGIELIVFIGMYIFGSQGLYELIKIRADNRVGVQELLRMRTEVSSLQREIACWQNNNFLREKVAREDLQMVCPGEEVYYIDSC